MNTYSKTVRALSFLIIPILLLLAVATVWASSAPNIPVSWIPDGVFSISLPKETRAPKSTIQEIPKVAKTVSTQSPKKAQSTKTRVCRDESIGRMGARRVSIQYAESSKVRVCSYE